MSPLSEFNRWHRVASEAILKAAHDRDATGLDNAVNAAVLSLNCAENTYQMVLALGVLQTVINMRVMSLTRGESQGPD